MGTCQRMDKRLGQTVGGPPEPERLPCPRCGSPNTKFCYYNNYNLSQPRHYCKSCRRYWTHGGTLRDIPIGGGRRRNPKRCRIGKSAAASTGGGGGGVFSAAQHDSFRDLPAAASQFLVPLGGEGLPQFVGDAKTSVGSFTSLLNSEFGLGVGNGLGDMGFGVGQAVWPYTEGRHTWQMESGDNSLV